MANVKCDGCRSAAAPIEFWKEKPEGVIRSSFRFCLWCFLAFRKGEIAAIPREAS